MLRLRYETPPSWVDGVLADFDAFLQDHAHNERKVSQATMALAVQHPDRVALCDALVDVAIEELTHFKQIYDILRERGLGLGQDAPDPYMTQMIKGLKDPDKDVYLRRRLLVFGIVEARGCERFSLVADALPTGPMKALYLELAKSEARHHSLYLRLAKAYFDEAVVDEELDRLLDAEASIASRIPFTPRLH